MGKLETQKLRLERMQAKLPYLYGGTKHALRDLIRQCKYSIYRLSK